MESDPILHALNVAAMMVAALSGLAAAYSGDTLAVRVLGLALVAAGAVAALWAF